MTIDAPTTRTSPARRAIRPDGGALRVAVGPSSLGLVLVAVGDGGLRAVLLGDDAEDLQRDLRRRFPGAEGVAADAEAGEVLGRVVALVESPRASAVVAIDPSGTDFQRRVWQALREIPAGATATYTDIARRIGAPRSVRAVAGACAANALAVVVPCHRVVRRDGGLSGYRWGVERKRALLEREGCAPV